MGPFGALLFALHRPLLFLHRLRAHHRRPPVHAPSGALLQHQHDHAVGPVGPSGVWRAHLRPAGPRSGRTAARRAPVWPGGLRRSPTYLSPSGYPAGFGLSRPPATFRRLPWLRPDLVLTDPHVILLLTLLLELFWTELPTTEASTGYLDWLFWIGYSRLVRSIAALRYLCVQWAARVYSWIMHFMVIYLLTGDPPTSGLHRGSPHLRPPLPARRAARSSPQAAVPPSSSGRRSLRPPGCPLLSARRPLRATIQTHTAASRRCGAWQDLRHLFPSQVPVPVRRPASLRARHVAHPGQRYRSL